MSDSNVVFLCVMFMVNGLILSVMVYSVALLLLWDIERRIIQHNE